jgi:thiamine-monophosphate kinase
MLWKTDCVVEGVHFLRSHEPERVGWKALSRAVSDIAAMGGAPGDALVTIFSPPDVSADYWDRFYAGLTRAATLHGIGIAGGEISRHPSTIAASIALTGTVPRGGGIRRGGGRPGDVLCVTGRLGGSLAGHHLDFVPRLREGQWLAASGAATAMMDLSDGLASDIPRLAAASRCGFVIDPAKLPLNPGCTPANALRDGEDFELLVAIDPVAVASLREAWQEQFPDTPLTPIGSLTEPDAGQPLDERGWDHFQIP